MESTFSKGVFVSLAKFPDEILVEYVGLGLDEDTSPVGEYKITSSPHAKYFAELTGQTVYTDSNLKSLDSLGYAVCHNTLDCHGRKVYIHHNTRTFREKKGKNADGEGWVDV